MKNNYSVIDVINYIIDQDEKLLRAKGAVSDLGTHWELVSCPPISDMGEHWDIVDEEPNDFGGNHTVYEWSAINRNTGEVNIYVGETGRTTKERFGKGNGYRNQPKAKEAIKSAGGWGNIKHKEILNKIKDRKTAEWYEKQVTKIRKANLGINNGGRGNPKGAKYRTGHNIVAIKDGKETIYRTITDAVKGTGLSLGTIHNRCKDGLCTRGYRFKWLEV